MKETLKILKQKNIKYRIIDSEDLYNLEEDNIDIYSFPNRTFPMNNRKYIFATYDSEIVGFAIIAKKETSLSQPLKNVYMLSNIEVRKDFRNIGIATNLIDAVLEVTKNDKKILLRTRPDELGEKYIFNQISDKIKNLEINSIPHNLDFIYYQLENKFFKQQSNEQKIEIMNKVANKLLNHEICKKYSINNIEDLSSSFLEESEIIISKLEQNKKRRHKP